MNKRNLILSVLVLLSFCLFIAEILVNLNREYLSEPLQVLWGFCFIVLSIQWARFDARGKRLETPFDFGFLMYVLWPIAFPWYLVRTRGLEGIVTFLGFFLLWVGPWLAGVVAYFYFT